MQRDQIIQICNSQVLDKAARCFNTRNDLLKKYPEYEGAANLVYEYEIDHCPFILRITFNPQRTRDLIQAELHFINYLSEQGVNVSKPVPSQNGNLLETIQAEGLPFHVVSFIKGKGMRVPDNNYRYRSDAPIEEYYYNWGRVLGQMHALTKNYHPHSDQIKRPDWFDLHAESLSILDRLPDHLALVRMQIQSLLNELKALPQESDSYGLIHGDFNDGNFTVDYTNGDMTIFDFDDSCYFWFMYEIASAWEGGIGRTMRRTLAERKSFMAHYMDTLMEGYHRYNTMSNAWLKRLPLFTQLIQVEEFVHYAQYLDNLDDELQGEMAYRIKCLENNIPYKGFFDEIYSPEKPFLL